MSSTTAEETKSKKESKSSKQESVSVDEKARQEFIKNDAEKKLQNTIESIRIPEAVKTYDQYIEDLRADNIAASTEREKYLKTLALVNFHIFPINTADINDPYAEPNYSESVTLEFRDVPLPHWQHYQKLKAQASDLIRLANTPLIVFQQTKSPIPQGFEDMAERKMYKELELYRYGFFIFFKGTKEQFDRCDYIYVRDRVDAAEYRVNNSLPLYRKNSTTGSTSTEMSDRNRSIQ